MNRASRASSILCVLIVAASALAFGSLSGVASADEPDPHVATGTPTAQAPLTTSEGVAAQPWADPFCPPSEGTNDTDPGVAPSSWSSFLADEALGRFDDDGGYQANLQAAIGAGWDSYVSVNKVPPPNYPTKDYAQKFLLARVESIVLSQQTWDGVVQRVGNIYKPTTADPEEFLAHALDYVNGVGPVACDGKDGYRLYESGQDSNLFQLSPMGEFSLLTFDAEAPRPPAGATFTPVNGSPRTYVVTTSYGNPRAGSGLPMQRVAGELTMSQDANVHNCAVNESTTETVQSQLGADLYDEVQSLASWVPFNNVPLPSFSESCATSPAVFTPWTNGPIVAEPFVSDRATVMSGYTATPTVSGVARWVRTGDTWSDPVVFAGATYDQGGDAVPPRMAISGDGNVIAGCWLSGPADGVGLDSLDDRPSGTQVRFPEVFNFATGSVTYPRNGIPDAQGCGSVSLDASGSTVWYNQYEDRLGWESSPTAPVQAYLDAPVLTLTPTLGAEATGASGAPVAYSVTAYDDFGVVATRCSKASGSTFALGVTTLTCWATNSGGTTTATSTVTVVDTTPPTVYLPYYSYAEAGPTGTTDAAGLVKAYDIVDPAPTVACLPVGPYPVGETVLTCKGNDAAGNMSDAVTTRLEVIDDTPPQFAQPPNVRADEPPDLTGTDVTYSLPVATDNSDPTPAVSCTPASGSHFADGATRVFCAATDRSGNTGFTSFVVTTDPPEAAAALPEFPLPVALPVSAFLVLTAAGYRRRFRPVARRHT